MDQNLRNPSCFILSHTQISLGGDREIPSGNRGWFIDAQANSFHAENQQGKQPREPLNEPK